MFNFVTFFNLFKENKSKITIVFFFNCNARNENFYFDNDCDRLFFSICLSKYFTLITS